jgi:hypothetical protein
MGRAAQRMTSEKKKEMSVKPLKIDEHAAARVQFVRAQGLNPLAA